jgi:Cysteine/serine-rich nuclear protein N-terminus
MESLNEDVTMGLLCSKPEGEYIDNVVIKCVNKEELVKETELNMEEKKLAVPVPPAIVSPLTALQDLTREYQEIDPVSSKSTSLSEVEEGQILESSSDASDLTKEVVKKESNINKRPSSVLSDADDAGMGAAKKPKKKISFSSVTAYYFPRAQGFTCIPSQGGSTLGMALKHSHEESFTLAEHANYQRRNHRRYVLSGLRCLVTYGLTCSVMF